MPVRVGWIGLGAMGFPMATRLRRGLPKSSILYIYDIDEDVLRKFVHESEQVGYNESIIIAKNAREVAELSDVILTIVPEGEHVKAVYLTPGTGLLAADDVSGKIFIDCSTIDIATSSFINQTISNIPHTPPKFYDAPVSGGTAGAAKGTLSIMLGASPTDPTLPLLHSLFSHMGTSIHTLGGPTLGLAAKISNNYLSGTIALATAEAMNLGMRLGLDPVVLSRCFATSSGASWVNETINPVPGVCPDAVTSKGYEGGFKVQLMKKDLGLAVQAAERVGARLVLGNRTLGAYSAASEDPRCRDRDSRVVYRW
ncbi:hypothetical protein AMATHDRAFT_136762 [Amanita thiersii Skay4041]|uniref:3-hydroxyisobutyrate dehydrogenase n=1 Tax=Amanita thiersii Skay4041 TaxID=703135 RepID=A0A2A9P081_9AGAR|nr:hypothetical protein AMATHDRAFT_136762 [Amanita thiersii Skay4041]